jgi:Spy/CpxP family protein refolding chaperone
MKKIALAIVAAMVFSSTAAFAVQPTTPDQALVRQVAGDHPAPPGSEDHGPGIHGHHDGERRGGPRSEGPDGIAKDLDLTREQRAVLHQTMREGMEQHKLIVGSYLGKLPEAEQHALTAELKASHEKQVAKFMAVLTPAQKAKSQEAFKKFAEGHERESIPMTPGEKAVGALVPPPSSAK